MTEDIYEGMPFEDQVVLGEQIKLLWQVLMQFKPHRDLLERLATDAEERARRAVGLAAVSPFGYQVAEKKHERVARRARLLVEMLDCLEDTDAQVLQAEDEKEAREIIAQQLGLA